jgi:hypothetical protein
MIKKYIIYDLECLANFWSATFMDYETKRTKVFVIHMFRNDIVPLMKFLREVYTKGYTLIGFNCNGYDSQLIEYIAQNYDQLRGLNGDKIARAIYGKSQWVIGLPDDLKWKSLIPEWKLTIPHIDIYRQKHYDGKGKRCSLKWLEFTMRMPNIQSMPMQHYEEVTLPAEIDDILVYNLNDVDATRQSFVINLFETDLRIKLSEHYQLNLLNASEPRLGREIFGHIMADKMGIEHKVLKGMRTYRSRLNGADLIFPYIKFKDPTLNAAKEFYEKLDFNPYKFEENNYGIKEVNKKFRFANLPEVVTGLGGLHACAKPGVYEINPEWEMLDIDGKSYYPNLGIKNRLYPEHLDEIFCDIYEDMYKQRTLIPKEDPVNYAYKIILNGVYGQSKELNNLFHDPKYTFMITINGQLLLLKLAELLRDTVPGVVFYQFNTDGITIGYHPKYKPKVEAAMKKWEKVTKIELETKLYKKMVIMDVNNYMAIDLKNKVKRKGRCFAYSMEPADKELDYHKNPSALVIPKALEQFFLHGTPVEEYIRNCTDIYDFCIGVKIKKDFDLLKIRWNKKTQKMEEKIVHEQVVRFFVSKAFMTLKKKYRPGSKKAGQIVEVAAKHAVTMFNTYKEKKMEDYKLDYRFYIQRAKKIINEIIPNATNLKMF